MAPATIITQSSPTPNFTLVTYNIWGLPSWMTGAPGGRYPKIARELEHLDPDVILLQEAWTAKARKSVPAGGQWFVTRAARQHTFFQQCGLVTLTKFPVVGGEFYPFSRAAFPDRFVHKGAMKVTVRLPGGDTVNIWNVHLQDGGTLDLRRSQVRELAAHVRASEDGQIADIIGGDFNCTPDNPLFQDLEDAFGPSIQQRTGDGPFVTWDGLSQKPGGGKTLDYIFIRSKTPLQQVQTDAHVAFAPSNLKERLSDHFGIEAVLSLNPVIAVARQ